MIFIINQLLILQPFLQKYRMGQQSSKQRILSYQQNYKEIQKQQHPYMGTIVHLSHKEDGTKHFLKIHKYATQNQLGAAVKRVNKRRQLCSKKGSGYIIKTNQLQSDKQNELCGITYYLYVIYEDYYVSLGDLIRQRTQTKNYFSEDEVIDIVRSMCSGLIFLQDNGYKNYTITKESIVKGYKNQNNIANYKILDTQVAREMIPYHKILNHMPIEKGIYLSPQSLQQLANRNLQPQLSLKSDIFQLGMVTLEVCLLQSLDSFYDYDKFIIKNQLIHEKVKNLPNYSPFLKTLILQMLQVNQQQRIGPITLRQKLNMNESKPLTQNGNSGIGNSNVTQRTHKLSYPTNSVSHALRQQVLINVPTSPQIIVDPRKRIQVEQRVPRVVPLQHIKNITYQNPLRNVINKNQTFDQVNMRFPSQQLAEVDNKPRNRSTEKYRVLPVQYNVQQRRRIPSLAGNYHFYVPNHIRPVAVPYPPSNNITINNLSNGISQPELRQRISQGIQIAPPPQAIVDNSNTSNANPGTMQIKIPDIQISEQPTQKNQPITPINNLYQSNSVFGSPRIPFKFSQRQRKSLIDQLEVLTSLNADFRKTVSNTDNIQKIQKTNEYQSPNRPVKSSIYSLNQSTPIRKIQALALQSIPRNSFDQIIKQTQQQNEIEIFTNKKTEKNSRNETQINRPKTYGRHHFTNGAVYEGEFDSKGNFCGNGILYYPNGKVCYSGSWLDNSFHGFGTLNNEHTQASSKPTNYENFNLNDSHSWHHYQGQFFMDKKNGFGTLFMANGDKFSGCFVKDVIDGYGTFTSYRGQRISGIWNQNILKKL